METLNRPGESLPESQMYEQRIENGKEAGFKTPDGTFHEFRNGEGLVQIKPDEESDRATYVKQENGTLIPVELWLEQNK